MLLPTKFGILSAVFCCALVGDVTSHLVSRKFAQRLDSEHNLLLQELIEEFNFREVFQDFVHKVEQEVKSEAEHIIKDVIGYETGVNPMPEVKCETEAYPPQEKYALPWYNIDLDKDPYHRWDELMNVYKQPVNDIIAHLIEFVGFFNPGGEVLAFVDKAAPLLLLKMPREYRNEIKGMSKVTGVPEGRMVIYNIFYEIFSICTSIVAENTDNGQHFHARNLDFGLFLGWDKANHTWTTSELLRRMQFNLQFMKDGKAVFNQSSFAGYAGSLNAVRKGLSISVNERFSKQGGPMGLYDWIVKQEDLYFATWLVRDIMTAADEYDYTKAVKELSERPLISPCYFIVSGVEHNQGIIISRAINDSIQPLEMNTEQDRWYLLETNYDHWEKPLFIDDRRTPGCKCMNESSAGEISKSHMFNVLSTDPNLNQLTTFTVLMSPTTGEMEAYRQFCPTCYIW